MKHVLLWGLLLIFPTDAFAHRLDELLQATRIAVTTNRIDFTFDLTPGVAVADRVLALINPDGDGSISDDEARSYARQFLKDLKIGLNGKAVPLRLDGVIVPAVQGVRSGLGVIRIKATAAAGPLAVGGHDLQLTNNHLPAISVYLVNALRSKDPAVEIGRQTRDEHQKVYRLDLRVKPEARHP